MEHGGPVREKESQWGQLDAELTSDKAGMARQSREVKKQQASLCGDIRAQASDGQSQDAQAQQIC